MSQSLPIAPRSHAVCSRCGQATFHLRGLCRACDPCTVTLLMAVVDAALAADQTPALAAMVGEPPDNRVPVRELAA
jgi:hypothetical protein